LIALADLPALNAFFNVVSAALLAAGYAQIRRGRVRLHRNLMQTAFAVSVLFLISYLTYHYNVGAISFRGEGWVRLLYFFILITHIILAALVPVLALITLYRAWRGQFARHRRMARWTLPIWLYVSVTGVLVYLFLYQFFPGA
jgi:uncharacterized membrane protein YozB (DUF420 family)